MTTPADEMQDKKHVLRTLEIVHIILTVVFVALGYVLISRCLVVISQVAFYIREAYFRNVLKTIYTGASSHLVCLP